jgi:ribosomal protein S12 methylthiotransferase accessory factor
MDMQVDFPGGMRVAAHFGGMTVTTDQSVAEGGEASAPSPFALFQASLATCAGYYVLAFCKQRGLAVEGITLFQRTVPDPASGRVATVVLEIRVPPAFPAKYRDALVRAAEQCTVKKHLEHPPGFEVRTVLQERPEGQESPC